MQYLLPYKLKQYKYKLSNITIPFCKEIKYINMIFYKKKPGTDIKEKKDVL
jgi:hypothetical protein